MNARIITVLRTAFFAATTALLAGPPVLGIAETNALPAYARPAAQSLHGTIQGFDGAYRMYVRDVHGYIDDVTLQHGTVINPTGIRLQPGYAVTVEGHPSGNTFVAEQIDTPYRIVHRVYYGYYRPYPYWGWR